MSGANSTAPEAHSVHGTNPQFLVERITRDKIYAMTYWKEKCFGVSAAALVDLAMGIREFGGVYGGTQRCTDFICLLLKMLQIQPDKEIVVRLPNEAALCVLRAQPTRAGGVHQERGAQVCAHAGRVLLAHGRQAAGGVPIPRGALACCAAVQRCRAARSRARRAQPLYNDYRRVRRRATDGRFQLQHVDQFIDELLTQARAFMPHASAATC